MRISQNTLILLARTGCEDAIRILGVVDNETTESLLETEFHFQRDLGLFYTLPWMNDFSDELLVTRACIHTHTEIAIQAAESRNLPLSVIERHDLDGYPNMNAPGEVVKTPTSNTTQPNATLDNDF